MSLGCDILLKMSDFYDMVCVTAKTVDKVVIKQKKGKKRGIKFLVFDKDINIL